MKYIEEGGKKAHWNNIKVENFINNIVGEPIVRAMLKGMLND